MSKRIVYTNKSVSFQSWCEQTQERFQFLGMLPFDESRLNAKHAYELGYTPDSWAREVQDSNKRAKRVAEFKLFNPE